MNILTQLCSKLNLMKSTESQNSFDSLPIVAHFEIVPIADHKIDSKNFLLKNFRVFSLANFWQYFKNDKINAFVMPYSVIIIMKSSTGAGDCPRLVRWSLGPTQSEIFRILPCVSRCLDFSRSQTSSFSWSLDQPALLHG